DVAEAVGFPDRRYFSSSFKKAIGMSPSDYQRRLRGINETGSETNTAKDN
ncbi:AraC family transcriptional regulator, partial [uncultured Muribaculum sp.]